MFIRGRVLYYTDSYGYDIRTDLNKAAYILKHQEQVFLIDLIYKFLDNGGILSINPWGFQKLSSSTNTCGRYAVVRLFFQEMDHDQFHRFLQMGNLSPDQIVSFMTWEV